MMQSLGGVVSEAGEIVASPVSGGSTERATISAAGAVLVSMPLITADRNITQLIGAIAPELNLIRLNDQKAGYWGFGYVGGNGSTLPYCVVQNDGAQLL